jgi:hypothetical protein
LINTIIFVTFLSDFMNLSLITALSAAMALSAYGQSAEWIAQQTGNPLSLTKNALAMGFYDPSTSSTQSLLYKPHSRPNPSSVAPDRTPAEVLKHNG